MKLFSNKLFLGGLIGCLIFIVGVYLFIHLKAVKSVSNRIPQDVSIRSTPQTDVPYKVKENTSKPVASVYYEGTTVPIMTEAEMWKVIQTKHTDPQTVEALMESYQRTYLQHDLHRKLDIEYPPEPWLQSLLDRGITIMTYIEYVKYMNRRGWENFLDYNADLRKTWSDRLRIPESDRETLKTAYLEVMLERDQRINALQRSTEETIAGGVYIGNSFLPVYLDRETVYVQSGENSMNIFGTTLTLEQRFNLFFRGVEPEDIEVIYIDEMGNHLSEKPEPVTREGVRKMMADGEAPPPKEWWDPKGV